METCEHCGEQYARSPFTYGLQRFCSSLCKHRAWNKAHPEKVRAKTARYRLRNPESGADWRAKNPDYFREWAKDNPERTRALGRASQSNRRAKIAGNGGSYTADEFTALCEAAGWRCTYCGGELTAESATADHVVPIDHGGTSGIDNITPACMTCNQRKGTKSVHEFMGEGGVF